MRPESILSLTRGQMAALIYDLTQSMGLAVMAVKSGNAYAARNYLDAATSLAESKIADAERQEEIRRANERAAEQARAAA